MTIGTVSGGGAVTVRYASGGNATDVNVSRAASQEAAVAGKATLEAEAPAHIPALADWHVFTADASLGFDPIAPHIDAHGII